MLKKLIKYEFQSVSKIFLPLYAVVLVLALVNRISLSIRFNNATLPQGLLMIAYVMLLTALFVVVFVLGVTRFRKNLLTDEGYLMFTLPVTRASLVYSKLFSAVVWTILGGIVGVISVFILLPISFSEWFSVIQLIPEAISQLVGYVGGGTVVIYAISAFIFAVVTIVNLYLPIYLAMAIGQLFNKNKIVMSFVAYFGINFAWQILFIILGTFANFVDIETFIYMEWLPLMVIWFAIIWASIQNVVSMVATNYILKNKLNLE